VTHEDFPRRRKPAPRIVLVGGGYIAAEFAHIARACRAQVTIVQRDERMLSTLIRNSSAGSWRNFGAIGVDVHTRTTVEASEKTELPVPRSEPLKHYRQRTSSSSSLELAQSSLARRRGCGCRHTPRGDLPLVR